MCTFETLVRLIGLNTRIFDKLHFPCDRQKSEQTLSLFSGWTIDCEYHSIDTKFMLCLQTKFGVHQVFFLSLSPNEKFLFSVELDFLLDWLKTTIQFSSGGSNNASTFCQVFLVHNKAITQMARWHWSLRFFLKTFIYLTSFYIYTNFNYA